MAMITTLTDSATGTSIDFYDTSIAVVRNSEGNSLGEALTSPRTISLDIRYNPNRNRTREQIFQDVNTCRRMLLRATLARLRGLGRQVTLTIQADGLSVPTIYDVLGGRVPVDSVWDQLDLVNTRLAPLVELDVEPLGRSAEAQLVTTGALYGINAGVTYHYLHYTGATVFGTNNVGRVEGSLWQSDRLTASPTLRTPQNGDILYWGNDLSLAAASWDRIIFGIRTARTGTITGVWEYSNGAGGWTTFTPLSDFRTGGVNTEFDKVADLGAVSWAGQPMTGWGNNTVNGISSLWVRYRITSFTNMPVVPVIMNGPFRSHMGVAVISNTAVKGDLHADALIHLANASGGNDIAGVRAAIATGLGTDIMPPFTVEWETADLYAPISGDVTVAAAQPATSFAASGNWDVAVTAGTAVASAADKAQHFSGGQYVTATTASSDKIDQLGSGNFFIEVLFKLDSVPADPTPLISRWTSSTSTKCWWGGIDQGRLRWQVMQANGSRKTVNGTTDLKANTWYLATFEWVAETKRIRIYLNGVEEATANTDKSVLRTGQTVALRVGVSVSFSSGDAKDGNSSEQALAGTISYVWIVNQRTGEPFIGSGHYDDSFPGDHERVSADAPEATAHLLWAMNDYAASATILDTTTIGTAKNGTRTTAPVNTNDAANARLGYYSGGIRTKALGTRLPQCLGEQYAGTYRVLMACAPPSSGFTDLASLELSLQFNVGDINLPLSTSPRRFPDLANVRGSSRYHLLDFGPVTLPPAGLYDGHGAVSDSARNYMQCYLFVTSSLSATVTFWVDCLYFLPLETWYGQYDSFRSVLQAGYQIINGAGLMFDSRGPENIVAQVTTQGYQYQTRNPYAKWEAGPPRLVPQRSAWLFAIPTYPENLVNDSPTRIGLNPVTPRIHAIPRWVAVASA